MTIRTSSHGNVVSDRMSIMTTDTAVSARSMREPIMRLYGHQSYYQIILDPREGKFDMTPEILVDHTRISMIIEDHLHPQDMMQSLDLSQLKERNIDIQELAERQRSTENFDIEVSDYSYPAPLDEGRYQAVAQKPAGWLRSKYYVDKTFKEGTVFRSPLFRRAGYRHSKSKQRARFKAQIRQRGYGG
ncbi:hypothetical protein IMSHALPRED_005110 [Imshaugia aleurites]|uniref:Uncharacterized protein n=1 Tax=Imshaugia aleurites TaxID=172621 RepID=A0A8H3F9J3_9LECA|nr:hypothetical protein IMSHALPRED_005110 [Imshaugia aleurites]